MIRGEIRKRTIASFAYGIVAARLARPLIVLAENEQAGIATVGECGYRLRRDPDTVLAPAAAFIANEDLPPPDERDFTTHVCIPTLAIEVVSPSNTRREVMEKVEAYREAGIPLI
ncbi:MAG: Uma2 family endonuclease [Thermomicrobiales bacterium]